ncbi:expressed unknown protein [Seminavis robusta]|uniref:Uncharacterized protein n=1 Tax=Seminavis robusta TaxID=568900 RepID=A0A9N8HAV8_9STRA|nr:expressed unknown protein [Seminavis robusta]|eukprot:Sro239_g095890.1 n/a (205) ;mRNA; r:41853-42765
MKLSRLVLAAALSVPCDAFVGRSPVSISLGLPVERTKVFSMDLDKPTDEVANDVGTTAQQQDDVSTTKQEPFRNDGLFSFMQNFFVLHETGKSMSYFIPLDADTSKTSTPEQIAQERKLFSEKLMNIGMDERERRRQAGKIFAIVTAVAILDKVNKLNLDTGLQATAAAAAFAVLPQSASAPLVFFGAIFGALYFLEDKIPDEA